MPASQDLLDMFLMATGLIRVWSPWIFVEALMLRVWEWVTQSSSIPSGWLYAPSPSMPIPFEMLSLFLRLPALAFDIATAFTIYFIVKNSSSARNAKFASLLWFLNPYTFFAVEMLGVPDVAATFMVMLATLLILHKRNILPAASLAAGVALKLFPLLIMPAFLILQSVRSKGVRYQIPWLFAGVLGFVAYFTWALLGSGGPPVEYSPIDQPLTAFFVFLPATKVSISLAVMVVVYFCTYEFAKNQNLIISDLALPILLVYLTFTDPSPQYYTWAFPLLILDIALVERRRLRLLTILTVVLFFNWFYFSSGFITPNRYSLLLIPLQGSGLPWYSVMVNSFLQGSGPVSLLLNAALYGTTLIYALEIARGWSRFHSTQKRLVSKSAP